MTAKIKLIDAMRQLNASEDWRRYQVDYPDDRFGRFSVETYSIAKADPERLRYVRDEGMARDPGWGTFRKLIETKPDGRRVLWMSDTAAEIREHYPFFRKVDLCAPYGQARRLLVSGLGLGVAVKGALTYDGVEHIDAVEINPDVAELISRHLPEDKITVRVGDAHSVKWPKGTTWDLAWHDIWPTISDENLSEMDRLMRRYRSKAGWQGCWQREGCLKMARQFKRMEDGTLPMEEAFAMLRSMG